LNKNTIIIVSGIRRAGTSMLMQMLEKGGCPIAVDNYQEADQYNPNGYYDYKSFLNVNRKKIETYNVDLIQSLEGKAVKLYTGVIRLLPVQDFQYKVILIERNVNAVWASRYKSTPQQNRKTRKEFFGVQQKERMLQTVERAKAWAKSHDNASILNVQYEELIHKPHEAAIKIESFLTLGLDVNEMAAAVDERLWNEKGDNQYFKTDRSPLAVAKLIDEYAVDKTYCEIGIGEGHHLNLVHTAKRKFGIERNLYGFTRCQELYPHLEIIRGDFFEVYTQHQFEVCFLWIIYPYCKRFISTIFQHNEHAIIIMGLNYWYHLAEGDEKLSLYTSAYPKEARADNWNNAIHEHLVELNEQGFKHHIKQVEDFNGELFSVAILQKA